MLLNPHLESSPANPSHIQQVFELLPEAPVSLPAAAGPPGSGSRQRSTPAEPWSRSTPALSRPGSAREKTRLTSAGKREDGSSSLHLGNSNIAPVPKIVCSRWPRLKPEKNDRLDHVLGGFWHYIDISVRSQTIFD